MSSSVAPLLLLLVAGLTGSEAQLRLYDLRASDLPSNLLGTTDGYVKVFCASADLGKTSVRNNDINPWWEEEFSYFQAQKNDVLRLEVMDSDYLVDDQVGVCQRQLQVGTHQHECYLEKGGTLYYTYTLSGN
ncbi:uncharacterized protein LOC128762009 [Synchiropus splendidus]|uniref:uncharacterized protein LOC128762009 n=1 Tax=Synchiropus splendidus TaxID=270530 RepID=UPI00237E585C|nr:uncharacterized protein LOC128762009 [Synchiropus splendidus]XP_053725709.1 uncharacterized protein LOC128762009 [Synchiropus splendidus]